MGWAAGSRARPAINRQIFKFISAPRASVRRRWAENVPQRLAAFGARELERFDVFWGSREISRDFPWPCKQFRIVDRDFVVDRVVIGDRESLDGVQIFAQIWDFARVRHA